MLPQNYEIKVQHDEPKRSNQWDSREDAAQRQRDAKLQHQRDIEAQRQKDAEPQRQNYANTQDAVAHIKQGLALTNQGDSVGAIAAYLTAIQLDPQLVVAHLNLGAELARLGYNVRAIAAYRTAIQLDPLLTETVNSMIINLEKPASFALLVQADEMRRRKGVSPRGGCFVATAVFDNPDHPVVASLRLFRDNWLQAWRWGRSFVKWYYRTGPTMANVIRKVPTLRTPLMVSLTAISALLRVLFSRK